MISKVQQMIIQTCSRWRFIIIFATLLALSPLTAQFASADSVISTIKVQRNPGEIMFNPVNRSMYVLNNAGDISVIDARTNNIITNITTPTPENIAFNPSNNEIYVTDGFNTNVEVISAADNKVIKSIPLSVNGEIPHIVIPNAIGYNPKNGNMYVPGGVWVTSVNIDNVAVTNVTNSLVTPNNVHIGSINIGQLSVDIPPNNDHNTCARSVIISCVASVIDSKSNEIIKNIPIGKSGDVMATTAGIIGFNPNNNNMYVGNYKDRSISIINSSNQVWTPVLLSGSPLAIAYNPKNGNMYVADSSNTISVIDWKTSQVTHISGVGVAPSAIAYNPKDGNMYVAGGGSKSVYVIDSERNNFTSVPLGGSHDATVDTIAYNPKNGNMYLTMAYDNVVKIVDTTPGHYKVVDTIPVERGMHKIALDPINNNMYVTNALNNTVSVIG
jgi:YVTN family beta-propeller protein